MPVLEHLLDLVLPRRCVGCAVPGVPLCRGCLASGEPLRVPGTGLATVAARSYDGAVRSALVRYKERGRRDLAGPLARLLADAVAGLGERPGPAPVLVPVPSARAAAAARGGDHMLRLARRCARETGLSVATTLVPVRAVADSAGLGAAARAANLAGALGARAPAGRQCCAVLVDDIVTTGATLREAARALAAAGWSVHGAAVVAATQRRGSGAVALAPPRHRV